MSEPASGPETGMGGLLSSKRSSQGCEVHAFLVILRLFWVKLPGFPPRRAFKAAAISESSYLGPGAAVAMKPIKFVLRGIFVFVEKVISRGLCIPSHFWPHMYSLLSSALFFMTTAWIKKHQNSKKMATTTRGGDDRLCRFDASGCSTYRVWH